MNVEKTSDRFTERRAIKLAQKPNPKEGLAAWLDELTKRTATVLKDLPSSDKVGDLLFDKETGLPL